MQSGVGGEELVMGAREWRLDREEGLRLWGKQLEGRGERLMGWRQERWLL